jgi:uncharacterized membrane protein YraQ (UPF0718 family)
MNFFEKWGEAAYTTVGFFWMALWAFILGYVVSSCIQVFVSRKKMQETMGKSGVRSVGLGAFFGFISSSYLPRAHVAHLHFPVSCELF